MSLSAHRLVVESFKFNDKNIRIVHIKNVDQYFVGIDVSRALVMMMMTTPGEWFKNMSQGGIG